MATQRYISTSFWDDEWIQSLDPSEKLLYLYLMTNPLTNIAGIYKITMRRISFDTGFNNDTVNHIMKKFTDAGKVHRHEEYVILPSWPKHQRWEKTPRIKDGIVSIIQDLPEDIVERLWAVGYQFDLSLVEDTVISSKLRKDISGSTIKQVYEKYNNSCAKCGSQEKLHIHHIKPVKQGGDNSFTNLELLCSTCHQAIHSPDTLFCDASESIYPHNYSDSDSDSDIDTDRDSDTKTAPHRSSRKKEHKEKYGPLKNVFLTEKEYRELYKDYGPWSLEEYLKKLSYWKPNAKVPCRDDNARIRKWMEEDKIPRQTPENIAIMEGKE